MRSRLCSTSAGVADASSPARVHSLTELRGLGPAMAERLAELDIHTPLDLLYHFPKEYTDRSAVVPIDSVRAGDDVTVVGTLGSVRGGGRGRWRRVPVTSVVSDDTAEIAVAWFNQPYLAQSLHAGQRVVLTGRVREYKGALQLTAPQVEVLPDDEADGAWLQLLPRYRTGGGLSDRRIRAWIDRLLDDYDDAPDPLPKRVRDEYGFPGWRVAVRAMHQPNDAVAQADARRRFVFEEFLLFQLRVQTARAAAPEREDATALRAPAAVREFQDKLPFSLTAEQQSAWKDIARRIGARTPANVLLQGDVGTGKTVLALQAALVAIRSGAQAAIMAPTEVLADQHAATVARWLGPLGVEFTTLTGGLTAADRRVRREALAEGTLPLVIGTHALFDEGVRFARLGLVIIDEQHRFGVMQRARLQSKGLAPHLIVMTATPIPRSLALTLYGEFDRLILRELPAGRQPVTTDMLGEAPGKKWIDRVRHELDAGRQAFWVCPLVRLKEEPEEGAGGVAATAQVERLRLGPLKAYRLDLLHGGMTSADKAEAMRRFAAGETDVLVCTSVIEVGVDVPNASVMVIEDAHRFGLAQLHQLRGRLGRGGHPGVCLLRGKPTTTAGEARLEALMSTTDGFEIATVDLGLRGPGEFLGTRQSGIPRLRLGHLVRDADIMDAAAQCARTILSADAHLRKRTHAELRARLGGHTAEILWL